MTMPEIRLATAQDRRDGLHWPGRCWCGARHDGNETGLALVAPPGTRERHGGAAT